MYIFLTQLYIYIHLQNINSSYYVVNIYTSIIIYIVYTLYIYITWDFVEHTSTMSFPRHLRTPSSSHRCCRKHRASRCDAPLKVKSSQGHSATPPRTPGQKQSTTKIVSVDRYNIIYIYMYFNCCMNIDIHICLLLFF